MDRYDAWKHNPFLRQIRRAAELDPDGRPAPMRPAGEWCQDAAALCAEHYRKVERDAMLRRAIRVMRP